MHLLSTEIASSARIVGEEKAIELLAKAGFEAWDFSMFAMCRYDWGNNKLLFPNDHPLAGSEYLKFARRLKKIGEDNGISCNQAHAPFPTKCAGIRSYYKRAIECSAEAGARICVIHPDNDRSAEENAQMYEEILPFAKECGVKIAAENMWNWDGKEDHAIPAACSDEASFTAHIDAVNDEFLVACLDIGHAEMRGLNTDSVRMIRALGTHLQALHIHDNDLWKDLHSVPFSHGIDFGKVVRALKEINYSGDFTLEADTHLRDFTEENITDGMKELFHAAARIREMFQEA